MINKSKKGKNQNLTEEKLILPPSSDISRVEDYYKNIQQLFEDNKIILLDASEVSRITTPFVQLLLAACKYEEGKRCRIQETSEQFINCFNNLGLKKELNSLLEMEV